MSKSQDGVVPRSFPNGIHPAVDGKALTSGTPLVVAPLYEQYVVLVSQNVGAPPQLVVKKGDTVKKGDLLAAASGFVSAPLHAPTSGVVSEIADAPGTAGVNVQAVYITADGEDCWTASLPPAIDWRTAEPKELLDRIAACGIVGMGGAAFPTHVKLSPPPEKKIDHLILNGAECEPFLTADDRLMLDHGERILRGAMIMAKILNVKNISIGIELNKPEAIKAMTQLAAEHGIEVIALEVQYPQGSEKQLIYAVTRRVVPAGGLPMDAGCVVQNVASAAAVADAVERGIPLIERIVTVSGTIVRSPSNFLARIGTPVIRLIELAGGVTAEPRKLIFGGPMMGFAQRSYQVPICKNTSGVLLLSEGEIVQYEAQGCIRCGTCVRGCAMHLSPGPLSVQIERGKYDIAEQNFVMDCLECGACAYSCPARRPVVQYMRLAKAEIRRSKKR